MRRRDARKCKLLCPDSLTKSETGIDLHRYQHALHRYLESVSFFSRLPMVTLGYKILTKMVGWLPAPMVSLWSSLPSHEMSGFMRTGWLIVLDELVDSGW